MPYPLKKSIFQLCRINDSDSPWISYIWDADQRVLTPCFDFLVAFLAHFLLFIASVWTIIIMNQRNTFYRLSMDPIRSVTGAMKVICSVGTSIFLGCEIFFSFWSLDSHLEILIYDITKVLLAFLVVFWLFHGISCSVLLFCQRKPSFTWKFFTNISWIVCASVLALQAYERWTCCSQSKLAWMAIFASAVQAFYLVALVLDIYRNYSDDSVDVDTRSLSSRQLLSDEVSRQPIIMLGPGDDYKGFFSKLTFYWTNPLMKKGRLGQLTAVQDIFSLPERLTTERLEFAYDAAKVPRKWTEKFSLLRVLFRCFGIEYFSLGILKFVSNMLSFAGPILLHYLVTFVQDPTEPVSNGYLYAFGMFSSTLVSSFCAMHFQYRMTVVGLKFRGAIITAVYKKLLRVSLAELADRNFGTGDLMNFMSTDTDRIVNFCPSFHDIWAMPLQLGIGLFLLYREVGLAFLAGLCFALILIPVNKVITSKIGRLSERMMHFKDGRVKTMTELLFGIRVVKLSAWEEHFINKINIFRNQELKFLKGRKYLDALCVYLWASAPAVIALLTFLTYSLLGNKLTAAKVFTSLALLNILIVPLNAFPWVLNGIIEAWISVKRLQKFFATSEINWSIYYSTGTCPLDPGSDLCVHDANFAWKKAGNRNATLGDFNLGFAQGHLIGIIGSVGSGKSSIFAAITGEIHKISGKIFLPEIILDSGFAYVAQESWLQHGAVRENILFGKAFEAQAYDKVVAACALSSDFQLMPDGDWSEVGEQGVTLSGGQKARISLARAVYQDKAIYLLDDPLAAVDATVGKHIWDECIMKLLRGRGKMVLIATHHLEYLQEADFLIQLDTAGNVQKCGSFSEVVDSLTIRSFDRISLRSSSSDNSLADTNADIGPKLDLGGDELILVQQEEKEIGKVHLKVYLVYLGAVGALLSFFIFMALFLMQASKNATDWWLAYWVNQVSNGTNYSTLKVHEHFRVLSGMKSETSLFLTYLTSLISEENRRGIKFYLTVYGSVAGANSLFTLARAFLFAYGGIVAAKRLHNNLLRRIIKAPTRFFDRTPVGRILNRFSSDLYAVDETLPFQANILLMYIFAVAGTLITVCYGLPWFSICIIVMAVIYYNIQKYYRYSTCELKRLSSISLSPIYSHFTDTITGAQTIRAFRVTERFIEQARQKLTANQRAQYSVLACSQWLSVRMQFLGVFAVTSVALIAVLQHHFHHVDAGLVGLALSYALSVTNILSGLLQSFTETEKELVSVERISDYIQNSPSERWEGTMATPFQWPYDGKIEFRDVGLKYGPNLAYALDGVSFIVESAEKIGIIGRTGSGKSSLFQALFRSVELEYGCILIDGVNIAQLNLKELRSHLTIIPQSPFLFSASLRENLDITGLLSDDKLLWAIEYCGLKSLFGSLGGLDSTIGERGGDLSVGERQLVCLARALLRGSKVVCIDEATAHVDQETDQAIQRILREAFPDSTVITIAHRLNTVADYDRIIVMDKGAVAQIGKPEQVLGL